MAVDGWDAQCLGLMHVLLYARLALVALGWLFVRCLISDLRPFMLRKDTNCRLKGHLLPPKMCPFVMRWLSEGCAVSANACWRRHFAGRFCVLYLVQGMQPVSFYL